MRKKEYLFIKKIDNRKIKSFKKIIQRRKSKRLSCGFLETIITLQRVKIKMLNTQYREGK